MFSNSWESTQLIQSKTLHPKTSEPPRLQAEPKIPLSCLIGEKPIQLSKSMKHKWILMLRANRVMRMWNVQMSICSWRWDCRWGFQSNEGNYWGKKGKKIKIKKKSTTKVTIRWRIWCRAREQYSRKRGKIEKNSRITAFHSQICKRYHFIQDK